jgi:hypothetical protein
VKAVNRRNDTRDRRVEDDARDGETIVHVLR